MADEMQGIMSLPEQPAMEQAAAPTAEQSAAVEQMRSQLSPSEVNTEMLGAAEEADPATVAEFKAELQGLELPPEVLDMLNTMVEEILDAPQDYEAIRAKYMAQGLEDLLPPEFDATFFGALNMAIDQIRGASPMGQPPMPSGINALEEPAPMGLEGFAQGGIASLGRNGDTMLAHINPQEAAMLRSQGGSGSINPRTGLPEFFSLKGAFKKIGRAVKKFAGSTVGKIVIGAALFAIAGPAAGSLLGNFGSAAVAAGQGFAAGAGTTLLAGGNLKDSLKAGAVSALTAGAMKGITQGKGAFKAIPKDVGAGAPIVTSQPEFNAADATRPMQTPSPSPMGASAAGPQISPITAAVDPLKQGLGSTTAPQTDFRFYNDAGTGATAPSSGILNLNTKPAGFTVGNMTAADSPFSPQFKTPPPPPRNLIQQGMDKLSPGKIREAGAERALAETKAAFPSFSEEQILSAPETSGLGRFYASKLPGPISPYIPLAATGLGIMALTGGLDEKEVKPPEGFEDFMSGNAGQRLLEKDPSYNINYGGVNTVAAAPQYNPYVFTPPRAAAKGGSMNKGFPRKNGPINGPGTGTSDDIPAMLSDGEFVFTAKAVRNMGDGSRRKGAKRMYALMRKLEGRSNG